MLYAAALCVHVTRINSRLFFYISPMAHQDIILLECVHWMCMCGDFVKVLPHCLPSSFASLEYPCFPPSSSRLFNRVHVHRGTERTLRGSIHVCAHGFAYSCAIFALCLLNFEQAWSLGLWGDVLFFFADFIWFRARGSYWSILSTTPLCSSLALCKAGSRSVTAESHTSIYYSHLPRYPLNSHLIMQNMCEIDHLRF